MTNLRATFLLIPHQNSSLSKTFSLKRTPDKNPFKIKEHNTFRKKQTFIWSFYGISFQEKPVSLTARL